MIIVGQDEDIIVNFDNVISIDISESETIYASSYDGSEKIGEYSTQKRAKEVLQEIIKTYSSYLELNGGPAVVQGQMDVQPNIFNVPKIYKMPKE